MRVGVATLVALAVALAACQGAEQRDEPTGSAVVVDGPDEPLVAEEPTQSPQVTLEPRVVPEGPARVVGSELSPDAIVEHLSEAAAQRYRPIGRDGELVFELKLGAPVDALFVPQTSEDPTGWVHELAAWRVARCIGLEQVAPAARRDVAPRELRERLDPAFADLWDDIESRLRWRDDGRVRGAAVLVARDVRPSGLSRGRRLERWSRHLLQGVEPDPDRRRVHADLADTILFDYLIANPGRFDDRLLALPGRARLVLRDHREAFSADADEMRELRERMAKVEKLTAVWAEGLARCDDALLAATLRDGAGAHLLDRENLAALLDRRRTLLSHATALMDAHGRSDVVVLP